jgi:anti-sigma factor RsiW
MEKAVKFLTLMNGPNPDHPSEDSLERFLLNRCEVDELEIVETHIFACEACVTRLETLELTIEATKLALQNLRLSKPRRLLTPPPAVPPGLDG